MDYTTLGRTGLKVSIAGLGCGGPSRLGQRGGGTEKQSIDLIHQAIDLGVNIFDTAHVYGTEETLGKALATIPRDSVILSTKYTAGNVSADEIVTKLDEALRKLGTDYIDIYHLHGVQPEHYEHARDDLAPVLLRERDRGKIRFLGITEAMHTDHDQIMPNRAVNDDCWDVMMILYNMMHQGARNQEILSQAAKKGIGTLIMSAARSMFSNPDLLNKTIKELAGEGRVPAALAKTDTPLGFLVHDKGADSVIDAAYRFARHEPGADVILFGTGNPAHMEANIASLHKPPLPQADLDKLSELFGHLRDVGMRET